MSQEKNPETRAPGKGDSFPGGAQLKNLLYNLRPKFNSGANKNMSKAKSTKLNPYKANKDRVEKEATLCAIRALEAISKVLRGTTMAYGGPCFNKEGKELTVFDKDIANFSLLGVIGYAVNKDKTGWDSKTRAQEIILENLKLLLALEGDSLVEWEDKFKPELLEVLEIFNKLKSTIHGPKKM